MEIQWMLCGIIAVLRAIICIGGGGSTSPNEQPRTRRANLLNVVEDGHLEQRCELSEGYTSCDPYAVMDEMTDDDWSDLQDIRTIMSLQKETRSIKFWHDRKEWRNHVDMLVTTNQFHQRFRMDPDDFDVLLAALEDAITVCFKQSRRSTGGNDPIYPEIVMACGLRFLGINDTPETLADLYGMSVSSARRVINMFLDAVDYNGEFDLL